MNDQRIQKMAAKLEEKEAKRAAERIKKYTKQYGVKKNSEEYDEVLKRYSYELDCTCGKAFRAYGQDLHQFDGKCPDCRKQVATEARKAKRKKDQEALAKLKKDK
jgi:nuclear transport factor 2 (NTF2) superfamily protein